MLDNRKIIYVGKAQNILKRMSQHRAGIMVPAGKEYKYGVLHDLEKMGHKLRFVVLERETSGSADALGEMEGRYIRRTYLRAFSIHRSRTKIIGVNGMLIQKREK